MRKFKKLLTDDQKSLPAEKTDRQIDSNLSINIDRLKQLFKDCSDIVFRQIIAGEVEAYLLFVDGLIDTNSIQLHGINQILKEVEKERVTADFLIERIISVSSVKEITKLDDAVLNVLKGNTVLLVDRVNTGIVIDAKGGQRRSVSEPETESVVRGPREGLTESLRVNTALVRQKIRSNRLKAIAKDVGEETKTGIAIMYIDGLVDPDLLNEVQSRLDRIKIDGVLESGYIEELIEDNPWSVFPQIQNTERPDTIAANLLEGRVAVIIDGTPLALVMPATFWQFLQASEDYYHRYHISIFLRLLRIIFVFIALTLPSIYVAVTTYHQEMIPTNLLFSIASAREAIPFPAFVEAMIMEISFEALREAGVRLPKIVGQAVSILGALVIGQAAVEAGIVSAPMVIVVSLTGIASFTIPRFNMAISVRLLRFPFIVLAGVFGLFGIVLGILIILTHLSKLRSFGIPYLSPVSPMSMKGLKDVFIRAPWWSMNQRPNQTVKVDMTREGKGLKPSPGKGSEEGNES
ncbi:spore germination protein [Neobacillus drentensis]|uniref:spore germination protein n=1 Tax=Neobacillus drentensis TaxID=220684 RepID=UPI001F1585F1|nr:spore germination protein [Neobacillus drentensis]ULT54727.1 spore germination protein [Neobacillus drentensis]